MKYSEKPLVRVSRRLQSTTYGIHTRQYSLIVTHDSIITNLKAEPDARLIYVEFGRIHRPWPERDGEQSVQRRMLMRRVETCEQGHPEFRTFIDRDNKLIAINTAAAKDAKIIFLLSPGRTLILR